MEDVFRHRGMKEEKRKMDCERVDWRADYLCRLFNTDLHPPHNSFYISHPLCSNKIGYG